jgi:hypothetical protein
MQAFAVSMLSMAMVVQQSLNNNKLNKKKLIKINLTLLSRSSSLRNHSKSE